MVNLIPGYNSSNTCAIMCDDECQNDFFPSKSSKVNKLIFPSFDNGEFGSINSLLYFTASNDLPRPELIDFAISSGVIPLCITL